MATGLPSQNPMRREVPMRLPHNPAAVVFDMDGLLFDTETLYQEAIQLAAAEGGHEVAADISRGWSVCRGRRAGRCSCPTSARHSPSMSSRKLGCAIFG